MRLLAVAFLLTSLLRCGSNQGGDRATTPGGAAGGEATGGEAAGGNDDDRDPWADTAAGTPAPAPAPAPPPERSPKPTPKPSGALAPDAAAFVAAHDRVRAQHCAPPMTWSAELATVAQRWADHLRDSGCKFGHSRTRFGENLAAGTSGALDPEKVVDMWYREVEQHDFAHPRFSMETGHFTQVVWLGSTRVGCGRSTCKGLDIYVCNYDPPGNVEGQYREQVLPTSCRR